MRQKLSILIYSMASGGAERVVSVLLPALMKHFDVTLVLLNRTVAYPLPEGLDIVFLEESLPNERGVVKLLKLPWLAWKYRNLCKKQRIDLSFSFMNRPNYINVLSKLMGNRAMVLINERAMPSLQYGYKNLMSSVNNFLIRRLYPLADAIVANSQGNRHDLQENYGIGKPIETIYNPVDLDSIKERAVRGGSKSAEAFTYVTIGRLDTGKNHQLLIQAMTSLKNRASRLLIIGEGECRGALEEQIAALELGERVKLLGRQNDPFPYLYEADCFVFSSNHEGFPNVILEALACGLPVISTDCPSGPREILAPGTDFDFHMKEGVEEAEYGMLVPVGRYQEMAEAMQRLEEENGLYKTYKEHATIRAQAFDKKIIIESYIHFLKKL